MEYSVSHYDSRRQMIVLSVEGLLLSERNGTVVHELAHAYHYLIADAGPQNACIKEAYHLSVIQDELYEKVPFFTDAPDLPNRGLSGSYARHNPMEYFATAAEAFWLYGTTNHYPWDRESLWKHDQRAYRLVQIFLTHARADCDVAVGGSSGPWWPE